ncbi:hypothetical protein CRM22_005292 [Opisthorchis felineus]|uniref:Uncharacterized protein n=1 Tax=Opisthorchis felineus TaxID=147828 RepID=A0A4V3SEY7_OPIFE|nr:hypothetical protein CRM22_005292 [Opisthorchis felineus]
MKQLIVDRTAWQSAICSFVRLRLSVIDELIRSLSRFSYHHRQPLRISRELSRLSIHAVPFHSHSCFYNPHFDFCTDCQVNSPATPLTTQIQLETFCRICLPPYPFLIRS